MDSANLFLIETEVGIARSTSLCDSLNPGDFISFTPKTVDILSNQLEILIKKFEDLLCKEEELNYYFICKKSLKAFKKRSILSCIVHGMIE